jgi:beta-glucanase (GH16 family)
MKILVQAIVMCNMLLLFSCGKKSDTSGSYISPVIPPAGPVDAGWSFETTPVFAEEFNYTGAPDPAKWNYDMGGSGWGNNELQFYTNALPNAKVDAGNLTITAIKEPYSGRNYTSARLLSKGTGDFLYGRVEVRAKLPSGRGTWPAIWMLPTDWAYGDWPKSGEIDIMEHVGYDPNNIHFSVHTQSYNWTNGTEKTAIKNIPTAMTDFHKYRVDWTPYALRGYYDDALVFTFINEGLGSASWPFDKRFHVLLNLAVGGNWGGQQGVDDAVFPASLVIDYVRVYKMVQ